MTIAEQIKMLRFQLSISQDGLSHLIGISQGAISAWERGIANPCNSAYLKLRLLAKEHNIEFIEVNA